MTIEDILKNKYFYKTKSIQIHLDKELDIHLNNGFIIKELQKSGFDPLGRPWRRYQLVWFEPSKYEKLVADLIRLKYSVDEENAIKTKVLENTDFKNEFGEFLTYRNQCKETAKQFIKERESAFERRIIV